MTDSGLCQAIQDSASPGKPPRSTTTVPPATPWKAAVGTLPFVTQRLAFGVLVLLSIIFLSYLGLDMAGGAEFGPAVSRALPKTVAYVGRLLHGDLGLTTIRRQITMPAASP